MKLETRGRGKVRLGRALFFSFSLGVACAPIAGIDEKPCVPGCADETTRLVCDGKSARTEPCSSQPCANGVCRAGQCAFEPAPMGQACGADGTATCNEGHACIGPNTKLSAIRQHTCLVADDGKVWCWGNNAYGELGDGTTDDRGNPVPVLGLPGPAIDVSAGYAHTCVVLDSGEAYCWGDNEGGQCGTNTDGARVAEPVRVEITGVRFTSITAGHAHTCALDEEKFVYCWGTTIHGISGIGEIEAGAMTTLPRRVAGLDDVKVVKTVNDHTCAVRDSAPTMVCWGSNMKLDEVPPTVSYKLGPGAVDDAGRPLEYSARPVPVELGIAVRGIGMGFQSTYAVTVDSGAYGWGYNDRRQVGAGLTDKFVAVPSRILVLSRAGNSVTGLTDVRDIMRSDGRDQCAELYSPLYERSRFLCWGRDGYGELAQGTALDQTLQYPSPTVLPLNARNLVRGEDHGCVLVDHQGTHEVQCFGAGAHVGNGSVVTDVAPPAQPEPTPVVWDPAAFESSLE